MPNKTSMFVWAYQAAVGTATIIIATSTSYEFGGYNKECGDWESPYVENPTLESGAYNKKTPNLTDANTKYPTFKHPFNPVSAQFLAWFLGSPVDTNAGADIVTISALASGMTYPLTIRAQEDGGSYPNHAQAVDCYCIGLSIKGEDNTELLVVPEFAWGKLEDVRVYDNLTTKPVMPAALLDKTYSGHPIAIWDSGGTPINLTGVWRADITLKKEWDTVSSDEGATQTIKTYKMKKIQIVLSAVISIADAWDDYIDRAVQDMTIQFKKRDGTSNILMTFTNCRITTIKKTGHRNMGHYGAVMVIECESVVGISDWFTEHGAGPTFATHWKAVLAA